MRLSLAFFFSDWWADFPPFRSLPCYSNLPIFLTSALAYPSAFPFSFLLSPPPSLLLSPPPLSPLFSTTSSAADQQSLETFLTAYDHTPARYPSDFGGK